MPESSLDYHELVAENNFLKSFLQMHSPDMGGHHCWRFSGGWLANQLRGSNVHEAVANAMAAAERENLRMPEMQYSKREPHA